MDLKNIELSGRNAALAATRRRDCPYAFGDKRKAWLKGYDRALQAVIA